MSDVNQKIEKIGNISFAYSFTRIGGGDVDVTIDPTFVIEHLRAYLPDLFNQSDETPDQIKAIVGNDPEKLAVFDKIKDQSNWTVIQTIMVRAACGLPYPKCGPSIRLFRDTLMDAFGAPSGVRFEELYACLFASIAKIAEAETLKKNSLGPQSSSQPTQVFTSTLTTSTNEPCKGCGSTSNPSEPVKTFVAS